jgi:hypothetical protein
MPINLAVTTWQGTVVDFRYGDAALIYRVGLALFQGRIMLTLPPSRKSVHLHTARRTPDAGRTAARCGTRHQRAGELSAIKTPRRFVVVLPSLDGRHERPDPNRPRSTGRVVMAHPERVRRICGEAGEQMASLVCLAPRNLRQRSRWRRLGVDYLASTQARPMGISNEAAKSVPITADGTNALTER